MGKGEKGGTATGCRPLLKHGYTRTPIKKNQFHPGKKSCEGAWPYQVWEGMRNNGRRREKKEKGAGGTYELAQESPRTVRFANAEKSDKSEVPGRCVKRKPEEWGGSCEDH